MSDKKLIHTTCNSKRVTTRPRLNATWLPLKDRWEYWCAQCRIVPAANKLKKG